MTHTLVDIGFATRAQEAMIEISGVVGLAADYKTEHIQMTNVSAPRKRGRQKGYKRRDMRAEG